MTDRDAQPAARARRERELLERYHEQGDVRAREELVAEMLPLARSLAARYAGRGEPLDDLVQVASVGLTEPAARKIHGDRVRVGRFPFRASGRALAADEPEGFVKLVFAPEGPPSYGALLGAHILGGEATEMIAEMGLALRLEATPEDLFETVHAHPTLAEAVVEAALAAHRGKALHI